MAVDVVVVPASPAASSVSTLVPASAVCVCVSVAASAYVVPTPLSYYATFAVPLVCFAREAWPDRVDAALASAGAHARRALSRARADLEADLRRLRDGARANRAAAPAYAGAEGCARFVAGWAGGARRAAEAKWSEYRDARLVLRLIARVVRLAAAVLFETACEAAQVMAPLVLGYLRGLVDGIRSSPPCKKTGEQAAAASSSIGFVLKDVVGLVGAGFYLLFSMPLLFRPNTTSGTQLCAACFAATCGLTMLIADWVDPPDDTDEAVVTTTDDDDDDAGETGQDEELEARESWRFLWVLILIAYCIDAFLLRVTLGSQPTTLAIMALFNFGVLNAGRQVQLTPDDGTEGAERVGGAVDKWRRGAMVVVVASSAKILAIYLVLDRYLAVLSFFWLFVMTDFLLAEEDYLSGFDAWGEYDEDGEEGAGFEGDITRAAEEEADEEARKEHFNTDSSEGKAEGCAKEEHCDSAEEHDNVEEQREEDPDCGSGGGSSDDGWELVDVDPEMLVKANCNADRKSRLLPWKHTA